MASDVTTLWTLVVILQCFCSTGVLQSVALSDSNPKDISLSLSNVTNKVQSEKNISTLFSNTSEHSDNVTSGGTSLFGAVPRKMDSGALLRGFYVLVGIGAVILVYVAVKMIRLRRVRSATVRKYGVLASQEDLEMAPLDADDEEEDTTLFDASRRNQL